MSRRTTSRRWIGRTALTLPLLAALLVALDRPRAEQPLHHAERLRAGDVSVRALRAGLGDTTLVLLHGYGESLLSWRALVDPLARRYRILAIDLPGFGLSDKPAGPYDLDTMRRRVADLLARSTRGPLVVVGHSMGGEIATALAVADTTRIVAVVLIAPAGWGLRGDLGELEGVTAGAAAFAASMAPLVLPVHDPSWLAEPAATRGYAPVADPAFHAATRAVLRDLDFAALRRRAAVPRQPTLLIWGRHDPTIPVEIGRTLASRLPHVRFVELPDELHRPHQSSPDTVALEIERFLAPGDALADAISADAFRAHYEFLAGDALEGRAPATRGGAVAARYMETQLRLLGLAPAGDSGGYTQRFRFTPRRRNRDRGGAADAPERATVNVVARLAGRGPHAGEVVVIGAHYDHLGIGIPVHGDSIYNGAVDNAAGAAGLLALAEAFARAAASGVHPARTVLFVAFGAEEAGLRGSRWLVRHPPVPPDSVVAMINLEPVNVFGRTRDAQALGLAWSTLGDVFRRAAAVEGLRVPDSVPAARESFYRRSDQLAFAEAGVPAIMSWIGDEFVDRPAGWADSVFGDYFARRYHQPSDEILPSHRADGAVQQLRVLARTALAVADAPTRPRWLRGAPYGASE